MALIDGSESWLQNGGAFFDGCQFVNVTNKRLSNPPSRGCGETTKKGLSNFFESPMFIGRDGEI